MHGPKCLLSVRFGLHFIPKYHLLPKLTRILNLCSGGSGDRYLTFWTYELHLKRKSSTTVLLPR